MKNISYLLVFMVLLSACSRPMSRFSFEQKERQAPVVVQFSNQSENAEQYLWDFGDGKTSTEATPSHRYVQSGNYTVKLSVTKGSKTTTKTHQLFIKAPTECLVEIQTEFGNMLAVLYNSTPKHRDNFLKLADQGFYDSLLFHRIIEGFMIQGGDPGSKNADDSAVLGTGGPGYSIDAEILDSAVHVKGALASARTPDSVNPEKRSNGSQFYIVQGRKVTGDMLETVEAQKGKRYGREQRDLYLNIGGFPFLDYDYTVFGRVIEGLDVIDKIAAVATNRSDRPEKNVPFKIIVIK